MWRKMALAPRKARFTPWSRARSTAWRMAEDQYSSWPRESRARWRRRSSGARSRPTSGVDVRGEGGDPLGLDRVRAGQPLGTRWNLPRHLGRARDRAATGAAVPPHAVGLDVEAGRLARHVEPHRVASLGAHRVGEALQVPVVLGPGDGPVRGSGTAVLGLHPSRRLAGGPARDGPT